MYVCVLAFLDYDILRSRDDDYTCTYFRTWNLIYK